MTDWDLKEVCVSAAGPLKEFSYPFKELTSLGKLVSLTSLVRLNVSFNCLTQLKGIQALTNLQQLNISHNSLTAYSLEQLSSLHSLTQLICSHNRISSTAALITLPGLQFLALSHNSISAAAEVLALSSLKRLRHLTLCKNPVCKQDNWRLATIGLLPSLQALDSTITSTEERAAASAHADVWAAAGQQEYSCSSTPRDISSAASECGGTEGSPARQQGSSAGRLGSRTSSGSAGRLRPRVSSGTGADDSMSIKDATSLLPSMTLKPLKPSTVVRRPAEAVQPSKYGYSRAKPLKVLQKQTYLASGSAAVLIHSDGSASLTWPEGSMAATLDAEEPPPNGSIASTGGSSTASSLPLIKGYRLLAMYRTITGVAASFDSSGGFVQWPNGQLMLVWNKKDGTAYGPDGRVTHTFNNRRKPPGVLQEDISARLDEHLSIRFLAGSHELQLLYDCEGCKAVLSQQHGAVMPERATVAAPAVQQPQGHTQRSSSQTAVQAGAAVHSVRQGMEQQLQQETGGNVASVSAAAAALAGLPDGGQMQALLARARALMAATDLSQPEAAGNTPADEAPTAEDGPAAHMSQPQTDLLAGDYEEADAEGCATDAADDLQAMMARARAAVAATSAALQELTV